MSGNKFKLSLGPILFNWPIEKKLDFYYQIAEESLVDIVYIGEIICHKRLPAFLEIMPKIIKKLLAEKKEVVFSSLALIKDSQLADTLPSLINEYKISVELNDLSNITLVPTPYILGPNINIYNELTLKFFANNGAKRTVLVPELGRAQLEELAKTKLTELELFSFGKIPLAISARCYHARAYNKNKAECHSVCKKDPDGLDLCTLNHKDFLAINGHQTLSSTYCNPLNELEILKKMGISIYRLSPHCVDMVEVSKIYFDVLHGNCSAKEGNKRLTLLLPDVEFANGYFHEKAGHVFCGTT